MCYLKRTLKWTKNPMMRASMTRMEAAMEAQAPAKKERKKVTKKVTLPTKISMSIRSINKS